MSRLTVTALAARNIAARELTVDDGHCATLSGASGSGKTLLLRALADLDPSSGEVRLDGRLRETFDAPDWRRRVAYLSAESHWWHTRVREHVTQWSTSVLAALGFEPDVLDWDVQRLSSGERQRLALARALAQGPTVLLLDEPTANLDTENTGRAEQLIAAWRAESDGCAIWVGHDPEQRLRVGDRHYRIDAGEVHRID